MTAYDLEHLRSLPRDKQIRLIELAREKRERKAQKRARENFRSFVEYMSGGARGGDYRFGAHHRIIASHADKVVEGEIDRLLVSMPPQHGKSFLLSVHLPAYFLGRFPKKKAIASAYGHSLARDWGRQVRNMTRTEEFEALFPQSVLAEDRQAQDVFNTVAGGGYVAVGESGTVTGRGADLFIIDVPV